jgi:glycosyltransferase involved in cell wall biosynthesis
VHLSVIIPSKDRREILIQTLDRLKKVENINELEIIIINDSDQELVLDQSFDFVTIYKNNKSGVASARNFGASKASHDWMVLMDDDMWVEPGSFQKLEPFCSDVEKCLNANWVYPDFLQQQLNTKPFLRYLRKYGFDSLEGWSSDVQWNKKEVFQVKGITSQFVLIHKNAFYKVGGYDTSFPFAGFEDYDMSKRLSKAGIKIYVDPNNMIYHNEADRIDIENWLERKKRGAITRRVGIEVGYKELEIRYPFYKKYFYQFIYVIRGLLLAAVKGWTGTKSFDKAFFLLVNILLGTYSCIGYNSKQAQTFINSVKRKRKEVWVK